MQTPESTARQLLAYREAVRPVALGDWHATGLVPGDVNAGYAAQAALEEIRVRDLGHRPIGYKIGATNRLARDMLGVDEPFFGRLYDVTTEPSPGRLAFLPGVHEVAEPEIALCMGRDLDPENAPYDAAAIEAATAALLPAIETIVSCFSPWTEAGAPTLIADNGAHGSWVMGAEIPDWQDVDPMEIAVLAEVTGTGPLHGRGGAVDGGAFGAAAWLANKLASQGRGLKAGDLISTGTTTVPIPLAAGQRITADFGRLGSVGLVT